MTEDIRDDWAALNVPPQDQGCIVCGVTEERTGEAVQWRCQGCHRLVCRRCTLCQPTGARLEPHAGGTEYYEQTLCSVRCWERVGRPEE